MVALQIRRERIVPLFGSTSLREEKLDQRDNVATKFMVLTIHLQLELEFICTPISMHTKLKAQFTIQKPFGIPRFFKD